MKTNREKRKWLLHDICNCILDDKRFRTILREVVLEVIVTQKQINDTGLAKSFMQSCREANVRPYIDPDNECRVLFDHPERVTGTISAVVIAAREAILSYLLRVRDAEIMRHVPVDHKTPVGLRKP